MSCHHGKWHRAVRAHCHPPLLTAPSWFQGESCGILSFCGTIFSSTVPNLARVMAYRQAKTLSLENNEKPSSLLCFLRLNWWVTSSTCDTNPAIKLHVVITPPMSQFSVGSCGGLAEGGFPGVLLQGWLLGTVQRAPNSPLQVRATLSSDAALSTSLLAPLSWGYKRLRRSPLNPSWEEYCISNKQALLKPTSCAVKVKIKMEIFRKHHKVSHSLNLEKNLLSTQGKRNVQYSKMVCYQYYATVFSLCSAVYSTFCWIIGFSPLLFFTVF